MKSSMFHSLIIGSLVLGFLGFSTMICSTLVLGISKFLDGFLLIVSRGSLICRVILWWCDFFVWWDRDFFSWCNFRRSCFTVPAFFSSKIFSKTASWTSAADLLRRFLFFFLRSPPELLAYSDFIRWTAFCKFFALSPLKWRGFNRLWTHKIKVKTKIFFSINHTPVLRNRILLHKLSSFINHIKQFMRRLVPIFLCQHENFKHIQITNRYRWKNHEFTASLGWQGRHCRTVYFSAVELVQSLFCSLVSSWLFLHVHFVNLSGVRVTVVISDALPRGVTAMKRVLHKNDRNGEIVKNGDDLKTNNDRRNWLLIGLQNFILKLA